jgi:hypothetical protein
MVAIDLGGRGDQDPLVETVAVVENDFGSLDVGDERADRLFDDEADADRSGQVVDNIALVDKLADDRWREDRVDDQVVVPPLLEVCHILDRRSGQIVERIDLPPIREQKLRKVGAHEARPARDKRLWFSSRKFGRHRYRAYSGS